MIRDVHHVGIAVRDMAEAYALYRDALGLPIMKEGDVPSRGVKAALLAVGGSYLELIQPTDEVSPFAKHIKERGEGLHHIGLLADDADSQVRQLHEMAVLLEDHEPREGFTGRLSYLSPLAASYEQEGWQTSRFARRVGGMANHADRPRGDARAERGRGMPALRGVFRGADEEAD